MRRTGALSLIVFCSITRVAGAEESLWIKLGSEPNLVVFMRHTDSTAGNPLTWDETGYYRGESVLTAKGKVHARKIGDAFAQHGVKPGPVISSPMCRCRETAQAAFGGQAFEGAALALLARHRGTNPVVFISHRPNIHLLTMELIDVGDLVVARLNDKGQLDVLGKIRIDP